MRDFYIKKLNELKNYNVKDPELNLRLIINNSTEKKNYYMINELTIKDINIEKFNNFFSRKIKGEPISKIINKKEFWSLDFFTNEHVLDPRPETELIIECVLKYFKDKKQKLSFCDLGVGSGCIIISLLINYYNSFGMGFDISPKAIVVAKKNSTKHKINNRLKLLAKDWKFINKKFDIILSNPPYIKNSDFLKLEDAVKLYDPKVSLIGGIDGLEKFKEIAPIANRCMRNNSIFILEIGFGQKRNIEKIFLESNLEIIEVIRDLQGIERVVIFKKIR